MKLFLIITASILTAVILLVVGCSVLVSAGSDETDITFVPAETTDPDEFLWWNTAKASVAVQDSAMATERGYELVDCKGRGDFRTDSAQYPGQPAFREFECVASDINGAEVARLMIRTTAPDEYEIVGGHG